MSKDINVVAALIFKDNKVLIAKRSTDKDAKGKWEFPGGKVEENEDEKIAIEREIYEEFDVKVKAKDFISQSTFNYPHGNVILKLYECEYIDGNFKLHAHSESWQSSPLQILYVKKVHKYILPLLPAPAQLPNDARHGHVC